VKIDDFDVFKSWSSPEKSGTSPKKPVVSSESQEMSYRTSVKMRQCLQPAATCAAVLLA
jgi:hypothetical protein